MLYIKCGIQGNFFRDFEQGARQPIQIKEEIITKQGLCFIQCLSVCLSVCFSYQLHVKLLIGSSWRFVMHVCLDDRSPH